ncbi:unnamed protein product [Amaranthus hypochondriacus]
MGISAYWCQMFILPRKVINIVNSICRSFFWFGVQENHKTGNVNWEEVCRPKREGGLGTRNLEVWNIATVGEIAWHLAKLSESIWVRWVHGVYTKGGRWEIFNAPITASWTLKKICAVKDRLKNWIVKDSYSIKETYVEIMRSNSKAPRKHLVWNHISLPKHRFVAWLATKQMLPTKDKLLLLDVVTDDLCPLCGLYLESYEHLFFTCPYNRLSISALSSCVGIVFRPIDKMDFRKSKMNRTQRKFLCALYIAVIYHVWLNRNTTIWRGFVHTPQQACCVMRDVAAGFIVHHWFHDIDCAKHAAGFIVRGCFHILISLSSLILLLF